MAFLCCINVTKHFIKRQQNFKKNVEEILDFKKQGYKSDRD